MRLALSFSGSGHLVAYQFGVARSLRRSSGSRITAWAGASAGAIAAAACSLLPSSAMDAYLEQSVLRCDAFGGLARALGVQRPMDGEYVLPDADEAVRSLGSSSLFIGATECRTGRSVLFSQFGSARQLVQCLLASCAIPRSAHPFDLLRPPHRPPTYPEAFGIVVPPGHEWSPLAYGGPPSSEADEGPLPFSPHGDAYVDGGLTCALPLVPASLGLRQLSVSPISGPRGELVSACVDGAPCEHLHVCPTDDSAKLPWVAPSLAGLRCYLSLDNLRSARVATGAPRRVLECLYERGLARGALA